jgi:hypothetical protein
MWHAAGRLPDGKRKTFVVETVARKCEPPARAARTGEDIAAAEECMNPLPYEELNFSLETGKLISRVDIQSKYLDPEKRLTHELELVEPDAFLEQDSPAAFCAVNRVRLATGVV